LEELDNRREAMSDIYKTYSEEVAEQVIYIRGFLQTPEIEQYVRKNYPDMHEKFREIMDR